VLGRSRVQAPGLKAWIRRGAWRQGWHFWSASATAVDEDRQRPRSGQGTWDHGPGADAPPSRVVMAQTMGIHSGGRVDPFVTVTVTVTLAVAGAILARLPHAMYRSPVPSPQGTIQLVRYQPVSADPAVALSGGPSGRRHGGAQTLALSPFPQPAHAVPCHAMPARVVCPPPAIVLVPYIQYTDTRAHTCAVNVQ